MLEKMIIVALVANFLMVNPIYLWLAQHLPKKPFTCTKCISFWICIILGLTINISYLIVAITSPFIAVWIERAFNALPVKLK